MSRERPSRDPEARLAPANVPFLLRPGRAVPPGVRRYDWHSKLYAACVTPALAAEFHGIYVNAMQRLEVAQGRRQTVDYCHRTITECICAIFCFHPDSWNAPYAKVRRLALLILMVWMIVHFFSNGRAM